METVRIDLHAQMGSNSRYAHTHRESLATDPRPLYFAGPTPEEEARETYIKRVITETLAQTLKELQKEYVHADQPIYRYTRTRAHTRTHTYADQPIYRHTHTHTHTHQLHFACRLQTHSVKSWL